MVCAGLRRRPSYRATAVVLLGHGNDTTTRRYNKESQKKLDQIARVALWKTGWAWLSSRMAMIVAWWLYKRTGGQILKKASQFFKEFSMGASFL